MKILNKKQCKKFIDLATKRLSQYLKDNNLKGLTIGISGGIDSAVIGILGVRSIDRLNRFGYRADFKYYYLDCQSNKDDLVKAKSLADRFNFKLERINLTDWYDNSPLLNFIPKNHPKAKVAQGNIKARLRMIFLYQQALLNNYICLDTGDFSEKLVGFWTRHGDEGDVKLIQNLTKTELYDLGEYLKVPNSILKAEPGDGLGVTKSNLAIDQLGLEYIYIEYIISRFVECGFDYNGSDKQLKMIKFLELMQIISREINKPANLIKKIIERTLRTSFKRKYGDYAFNLFLDRKEFGFLKFGTTLFNKKYLDAIIKLV